MENEIPDSLDILTLVDADKPLKPLVRRWVCQVLMHVFFNAIILHLSFDMKLPLFCSRLIVVFRWLFDTIWSLSKDKERKIK